MVDTLTVSGRIDQPRSDLTRLMPGPSNHKTLITIWSLAAFGLVFIWQRNVIDELLAFKSLPPIRPIPSLRQVVFNLTDFGAVGDGVTLNTEAFVRAVGEIERIGKKGGGQLNVPRGKWLTAPFNLTSRMTLFLAEGAVILGVQDEKLWPLMPPLPSYGYGREHPGPRYGSLIHGQNLTDVTITGNAVKYRFRDCHVIY